jgi:hypothetical protein
VCGQIAERVAARVAVGGGIGQLADADAVEDDDDRSSEGSARMGRHGPVVSANRDSRSSC